MALFTDGGIAGLTDLQAYESSILDLAGTERIDLGAKLMIAQREITLQITDFLLRREPAMFAQRELRNVVITEPLLHAHTICTLAMIYRDACNSQLNDRYQSKWKQYTELAERAMKQLFDIGVGIARVPLARATVPNVTTVPGSLLPGTTYFVKSALAGFSGVTGEWSDAVRVGAVPGLLLQAAMPTVPAGTEGWIVYAGESEETLTRQNEFPLPAGAQWTQAVTGLRTDLLPLPVQRPDYYIANRQGLMRG